MCSCGATVWDTNPNTCANNCIFYMNPKRTTACSDSLQWWLAYKAWHVHCEPKLCFVLPGVHCKSKTGLINTHSVSTGPVQITATSSHILKAQKHCWLWEDLYATFAYMLHKWRLQLNISYSCSHLVAKKWACHCRKHVDLVKYSMFYPAGCRQLRCGWLFSRELAVTRLGSNFLIVAIGLGFATRPWFIVMCL